MRMGSLIQKRLVLLTALVLAGCGGAGSNDVVPLTPATSQPSESPSPSSPVVPTTAIPATDLSADAELSAEITGISIASPPTITFALLVDGFRPVTDLTTSNLRFTFARLDADPDEPGVARWTSLINTTEDPVCRSQADVDVNDCSTFTTASDPAAIPDSALKVQDIAATGRVVATQATYERSGTLTALADGQWQYTMATDPGDAQDLSEVHRICIQVDLAVNPGNPCIDFVPAELVDEATAAGASSLAADFEDRFDTRAIVTEASCNSCHDEVAVHGGNRVGMAYCTTCHNPGTVDANSGNSQDLAVLIHRIHASGDLPSVQAGNPYRIWGFRNALHDYSEVGYPQSVLNCTRCHAGPTDDDPDPAVTITADGGHWARAPSRAACGSCHDDDAADMHMTPNVGSCASCHVEGGIAGSIGDSHVDPIRAAAAAFRFEIVATSDTAPGEFPSLTYRIVDPTSGDAPWDILNDDPFLQPAGASRIYATFAWSTSDYHNTGNGADDASALGIDALAASVDNGDGTFTVTAPVAIPDGSLAPFMAATGSGSVTLEGHPAVEVTDFDGTVGVERIPFPSVSAFFAIDDAAPVPRRDIVTIEQCNACHDQLSLHGSNRTDDLNGCATCHNPRNTDREVRASALNPPTDGKDEESLDFTTMIHGIHAAASRENPLQIVGFRGFTTYVYDESLVHYPGNIADCSACHLDGTWLPPLPAGALGKTIDTGVLHDDPSDDVVVSPLTAACAACHDDAAATTHMIANGGRFDTSQAALDSGAVAETCSVCHGAGSLSDVSVAHGLDD